MTDCLLKLQHDVVLLHGDRHGLSNERTLCQRLARHHLNVVSPRLYTLRVTPGLARLDVELPTVPRTPQHFAVAFQPIFAGPVSGEAAQHEADAQWRAFVRATVDQRVELTVDVEDADRPTGNIDDLAFARRDLADGCDDVPGQRLTPGRRTTARSRGKPSASA